MEVEWKGLVKFCYFFYLRKKKRKPQQLCMKCAKSLLLSSAFCVNGVWIHNTAALEKVCVPTPDINRYYWMAAANGFYPKPTKRTPCLSAAFYWNIQWIVTTVTGTHLVHMVIQLSPINWAIWLPFHTPQATVWEESSVSVRMTFLSI